MFDIYHLSSDWNRFDFSILLPGNKVVYVYIGEKNGISSFVLKNFQQKIFRELRDTGQNVHDTFEKIDKIDEWEDCIVFPYEISCTYTTIIQDADFRTCIMDVLACISQLPEYFLLKVFSNER